MTFKQVFATMFIVGIMAILLANVSLPVVALGVFIGTSAIIYLLVFAGGTHNP